MKFYADLAREIRRLLPKELSTTCTNTISREELQIARDYIQITRIMIWVNVVEFFKAIHLFLPSKPVLTVSAVILHRLRSPIIITKLILGIILLSIRRIHSSETLFFLQRN